MFYKIHTILLASALETLALVLSPTTAHAQDTEEEQPASPVRSVSAMLQVKPGPLVDATQEKDLHFVHNLPSTAKVVTYQTSYSFVGKPESDRLELEAIFIIKREHLNGAVELVTLTRTTPLDYQSGRIGTQLIRCPDMPTKVLCHYCRPNDNRPVSEKHTLRGVVVRLRANGRIVRTYSSIASLARASWRDPFMFDQPPPPVTTRKTTVVAQNEPPPPPPPDESDTVVTQATARVAGTVAADEPDRVRGVTITKQLAVPIRFNGTIVGSYIVKRDTQATVLSETNGILRLAIPDDPNGPFNCPADDTDYEKRSDPFSDTASNTATGGGYAAR